MDPACDLGDFGVQAHKDPVEAIAQARATLDDMARLPWQSCARFHAERERGRVLLVIETETLAPG